MTPQAIISQCSGAGVSVHLNGNTVRLRGTPEAVGIVSDIVRQHKTALLDYLAAVEPAAAGLQLQKAQPHPLTEAPSVSSVSAMGTPFPEIDLVREFMEVDGMSAEDARAMAAVSIPIRPATDWLALIAELDHLIGRYCSTYRLSAEAQARILDTRNRQSLASIPNSLAWFRRELAGGRNRA